MNERIQELAEQAGLDMWINGNDEVELPENQKKFAELIVRECLHIVDDERDSTDSEFGKLVAEGCALKIMERFGVEE